MNKFKDNFIKLKKSILIPLLQREYVQGGRRDVIEPFLDQLVETLMGKKEVDLNYIYGYNKTNDFVPIDGQQRLITLWLLHLYVCEKRKEVFPVSLKFESREFACDFCENLKEHLKEHLCAEDLFQSIVDAPWFVTGWLYNTSVKNMLETLNYIHKKHKDVNLENENTDQSINFDFLEVKDEGLDDDVYVKMNGRGRPLSYFENLKSFMDEQAEQCKLEDWKAKMDNNWMDLFWKNRNKNQEHPEEIDDEQQRFFNSMLFLYWKQHESEFCKDENKVNLLVQLLDNKPVPLCDIEKYKLFNEDVLKFIHDCLEVLTGIYKFVNELEERIVGILDFDRETTTFLYKIAFKEATYAKTLPLLYALVKTPKSYRNKDLYQWVRLWRNLILNCEINADNIANVCRTIGDVAETVGDNSSLYEVISGLEWENGFGFSREQINEEMEKAKQILSGEIGSDVKKREDVIIDAEKHAFFKGAIRFLFHDEKGNVCWTEFKEKWGNAQEYFDGKGVKDSEYIKYRTDALLLKAVLFHVEEFWKYIEPEVEVFDNTPETWKYRILLNTNWKSAVHKILMGDLVISPREKDCLMYRNLYSTNMLNYVSQVMEGARIRKIHGHRALYPKNSSYGILLDDDSREDKFYRNQILSTLKVTGQRVGKSDFYWGWDINFKFRKNDFQWNTDGNVYLMEREWGPRKQKNGQECKCDVRNISSCNELITLLDNLINES